MKEFKLVRRIPRDMGENVEGMIALDNRGLMRFGTPNADKKALLALDDLMAAAIKLDRMNQVHCYVALEKCGALREMREFMSRRPETAFSPDFVDLWNLHRCIRARAPKVVWEFGSGLSTLVMAHALQANQGGRLFALEPDETWAMNTIDALSPHLREHCDVFHSPAQACSIEGKPTVRFADRPDALPEMIYVDGAHRGAEYQGVEDIYFLEQDLAPGSVVLVDGRFKAVAFFFENHLRRKWKLDAQLIFVDMVMEKRHPYGTRFGLDQFSNAYFRLVG